MTSIIEQARAEVFDCVDPLSGFVNYTELAEATAHALHHPEWLDDPEHDVWQIAIEVGDKYERTNPPRFA